MVRSNPSNPLLTGKFLLAMSERSDSNTAEVVASKSADVRQSVQDPWLPLHHEIVQIWREMLGVASVGIRDCFFDLGGDSRSAVEMLLRLEDEFKRTIPISALADLTVERLADELCSGEPAEQQPILKLREDSERPPFFYLHGDNLGGGFYCRKLATHLGEQQPFYVIPPADVQSAERAPSIEEMAAAHIRALPEVPANGRYALGGFCDGGLVAYEMARQLQAAGRAPDVLLLVDALVPAQTLHTTRRLVQLLGAVCGLSQDAQICLLAMVWNPLERLLFGWWKPSLGHVQKAVEHLLSILGLVINRPGINRREQGRNSEKPPTAALIRRDVTHAFLWAAACYKVRSYAGNLDLIMANGTMEEASSSLWRWKAVARNVRVETVPGGHLEAITTYAEIIAGQMSERISELSRR